MVVYSAGGGVEADGRNSSCFCRPGVLSGEPLQTIMLVS